MFCLESGVAASEHVVLESEPDEVDNIEVGKSEKEIAAAKKAKAKKKQVCGRTSQKYAMKWLYHVTFILTSGQKENERARSCQHKESDTG